MKFCTNERGDVEKVFETLTLSDSESASESDAECPKCGMTFRDDDSKSMWHVATAASLGLILNVQD